MGYNLPPVIFLLTETLLRHRRQFLFLSQLVSQSIKGSYVWCLRLELDHLGCPATGVLLGAVVGLRVELPQYVVDLAARSLDGICWSVSDRKSHISIEMSYWRLMYLPYDAIISLNCLLGTSLRSFWRFAIFILSVLGKSVLVESSWGSETIRLKVGERVKLLGNLVCFYSMMMNSTSNFPHFPQFTTRGHLNVVFKIIRGFNLSNSSAEKRQIGWRFSRVIN